MAGKGRRAASRQGQLNRKRKKAHKGPSGIPSDAQRVADADMEEPVAVAARVEGAGSEAVASDADSMQAPASPAGAAPVPRRAPRPSPVARTPRGEFAGQSRIRGERPAAYLYVGAELRRILILTSAIFTALIVLGIVL